MENKKETKIDNFLAYIAGICAFIGICAIVYKLYLFGFTRENIADASINLAQILTSIGVLFGVLSSLRTLLKCPKSYFFKELEKWNKKYGILTDCSEEYEKGKGKFIKCQMLRNHANILKNKDNLEEHSKAYINFVRIPTENLDGNKIIFSLKPSMFKKNDRKELEKYAEKIVEKLKIRYSEIIDDDKVKISSFDRKDEVIYIHLGLNSELDNKKEIYNQIIDMLDYMTMVYLAIA